MLIIDGSQGEGGGQILRTSLTMAMLTGTTIRIDNIRAGRKKPGLMRQHLTCVKAAKTICDAEVSGAEVGSQVVTFKPHAVKAGEYHFSVGTAGSTLLIFQTVLLALASAKGESRLTFEGGTHNIFAPSYDFIALAYVPLLRGMGVHVDMALKRHGFYPQGGGQWSAHIKPSASITSLELRDSGQLLERRAVVTSAGIPAHVAERELATVAQTCDWIDDELVSEKPRCLGSGNIVSLRLYHEAVCEIVESVGKVGVTAEKVAQNAIKAMQRYQAAGVAVGEYLADQLLLPMAIGQGGVFHTLKPSLHMQTNRDVIHLFTQRRFTFREIEVDCWEISL